VKPGKKASVVSGFAVHFPEKILVGKLEGMLGFKAEWVWVYIGIAPTNRFKLA
jgi:hypothetical protein